jgi:LEA14-like dessication related protein
MTLTKGQKWGIAGGVTLVLGVVGLYLKKQFDYIYNAKWAMGGVKNLKVALDKISFTLFYNVDNKGDLSVIISGQNYDVFVNGKFVSKITNDEDVKIKSNSVSKIPFYVNLDPKDVVKAGIANISDLLNNQKNVKILIKGKLNIKAGIVNMKKYPFELPFTLADVTSSTNKDVENVT